MNYVFVLFRTDVVLGYADLEGMLLVIMLNFLVPHTLVETRNTYM